MEQTKSDLDEVWFPSHRRREAEVVASFLPIIRGKARDLLGWQGQHAVKFLLAANPPGVRDVARQHLPGLLFWGTFVIALLVLGPLFGAKWLAVLAGAVMALVLAVHFAFVLMIRRAWGFAAGLAFPYSRRQGGAIVLMNLAPPPPPPAVAALRYALPADDRLRLVAAHEYAHIALRSRYRAARIPAWLDEGLASWFADAACGLQWWRPESRSCVGEPEASWHPRWGMSRSAKQRERYYRLTARYHWEVRHLAEAGRIPELLATPLKKARSLRPSPDQVKAGWL
jgi:hypothetical protein